MLTVKSTDDAVAIAKRMPNPLALHIFSGDAAYQRTVLDAVPSGSSFVNDVVVTSGTRTSRWRRAHLGAGAIARLRLLHGVHRAARQ